MEFMQCFEPGCKHEVEYSCKCTSPGTLTCEIHLGKHMKLPNKSHAIETIFVDLCKGTKEAILDFLTKEQSKISKLKGKILASFSQRLLDSESDIEGLLKNLDSGLAELSDYFIRISQTQKLYKSEQDSILGLLSLHPDEAIEKLKKIIPANQECHKSAKQFCGFSEKIEKIIECFIKDKFEAYLEKRLFNIENTLEEHNKIIKSGNEEHQKFIDSINDELANIKNTVLKLINENKETKKNLKDWKEVIKLETKNKMDQLNTQIINITQDLSRANEAIKPQQFLQEIRERRSEILSKPNDPEFEQDIRRTISIYPSESCIYDPPLQQICQDYASDYSQKATLYTIRKVRNKTNLHVYDAENENEEIRIVDTPEPLNSCTCFAQLPNGNLFCFGKNDPVSGISLIIDQNYRVQQLPAGTHCFCSSAIYFNNNVYCFGGLNYKSEDLKLSERFDLTISRWIELKQLPKADYLCNSIIFNGNILISGCDNKNLFRYSIDSDSFETIPYDFTANKRKILIKSERVYLIECSNGSIYESEVSNETVWKWISYSIISHKYWGVYLSYNGETINIAGTDKDCEIRRYKFNLKENVLVALPYKWINR